MIGKDSAGRLRRAAAFGVAVGLAGFVVSVVPGILEVDETVGLGALFRLRGTIEPPDVVAVVGISKDSAGALGQSTDLAKWPRALHAKLIEKLVAAGARTIVFDLSFDQPRDEANDQRLAAAIETAGNVVLLERVDSDPLPGDIGGVVVQRFLPIEPFKAGALATAPFILPAVPVSVSQFWTFGRMAGDTPSLPVAALQLQLLDRYDSLRALLVAEAPSLGGVLPRTREDLVAARGVEGVMRSIRGAFRADPDLLARLRRRLAALPGGRSETAELSALIETYGGPDSRYLNYYGPARTIPTIPYDQVLASESGLDLTGKTVFVGYSDPSQPRQLDFFHSVFSERTGSNLSGVEIGATAFANLLEGRALKPLSMPQHLLLVLLWGTAVGTVLSLLSTPRAFGVGLLAAAGFAAAAYEAFAASAVWLPLLVPVFVQVPSALAAVVFANYRELNRRRHRVEIALGYYLPAAEVRKLAEASAAVRSGGRLLHGTCLFTDAEQYTTVSETLRPEALAELMNDYYRAMFEVVQRHGGFVSDTAGDSMVAVWATAQPDPDSNARACRAALEILEAIEDFNRHRGRPRLPTRVGLDSGEILLGNIGAEQRFEYRAIGDIVNTASRIQGFNKWLGTRALVSESALDRSLGVTTREVGDFLLRGKTLPVRLYELSGTESGADEQRLREGFAAALERFRKADWERARQAFAELAERFPQDGPTRYYLGLAGQYCTHAPDSWDGAIAVSVK